MSNSIIEAQLELKKCKPNKEIGILIIEANSLSDQEKENFRKEWKEHESTAILQGTRRIKPNKAIIITLADIIIRATEKSRIATNNKIQSLLRGLRRGVESRIGRSINKQDVFIKVKKSKEEIELFYSEKGIKKESVVLLNKDIINQYK